MPVPQETRAHNSSRLFQHCEQIPEGEGVEVIRYYLVVPVWPDRVQAMRRRTPIPVLAYTIAEGVMGVVFLKSQSTGAGPEEHAVQMVDPNVKGARHEEVDVLMTAAVVKSGTQEASIALLSSKALSRVQAADSYLNHWV